jgi:hypothetical protein
VCRKLSVQYLWVDAICIAQRPYLNPDKELHVGQMDRIYRYALLTICAASSTSAATGMTGLHGRANHQEVIQFQGKSYIQPQSRFEAGLDLQLWSWRAWTLQERMLSRRTLFNTERQAYWACQCDTWMESTVANP